MDTYYYKQPRYFEKFKCIGGECPINCCDVGWNIFWSQSEIDNLNGADMSDDFRKRIDDLFVPLSEDSPYYIKSEKNEKRYRLKLRDDGKCPFHNPDSGLCDMQKTLGEKYLSYTCRVYPRRFFASGKIIVRSCSSSCPAVLKMILKDKRACELEMTPARNPDTYHLRIDTLNQYKDNQYLAFRVEILDFYNDLFRTGSQNASFDETVLLGALAAKAMSQASDMGHAYEIPIIAADCKKKLKTKEHIQWAKELEPNLEVKFQLINMLIASFSKGRIDISPLYKDGKETIDIENYKKGRELFEKAIPEHDKVFKAIALNIFLDTFMFVRLQEFSFFEFYAYFTVCLATMQVSAYLAGLKNEDIENEFVLNVAELSTGISHDQIHAKELVNAIHKADLIYPPQLAFIIKS